MLTRKNQFLLFICSVFVHLFYYVSAYFTHTLDIFFVHVTPGQDFFQIPNAAYAFLHGGSLTGLVARGQHPYIACCGINNNVYHPLFTLLVGIPLQLFPPWTAFGIWAFVHFLTTVGLIFFLWIKFRHHKYVYLGLSLFLFNSYWYYEIRHAQYHFLFVFFTMLFLYESITHGDSKKAGIWLFFSLLDKPIGLLWIVPLLLYKRFRTVVIGFGVFAVITALFTIFPFGRYYLLNFVGVSLATIPSYNLYAIQFVYPKFPLEVIKVVSLVIAFSLPVFQIQKKLHFFTVISFWIGYQLLFYGLVYHYHYTVVAAILCLGFLFNELSPKVIPLLSAVFLTLQPPIVLFHLVGITNIPRGIWLWSDFWLVILLVYLFFQNAMRPTSKLLLKQKKESM